jgi:DNA-directed RNA polymerase subunit K/omega
MLSVLRFPEPFRTAPAVSPERPASSKPTSDANDATQVRPRSRRAQGSERCQGAGQEVHVVERPEGSNRFEFVVVSALRTAQLVRGCTPRVPEALKRTTTAQLEVAAGKVAKLVLTVVPVV